MKILMAAALQALALTGLCTLAQAQQISDEQRSAIRNACRNDYMNVCPNVPTGGKDSLQCLQQHSQAVSAGCRTALSAASPPASSAASAPAAAAPFSAGPAAAATAAPAVAVPAHTLAPREEARLVRTDCGGDFQKFCADVRLGGGRAAACLRAHVTDLTPACKTALASAASP